MTAGSVDRPPILVLGLGNLLLQDDGLGLKLLERVQAGGDFDGNVEFVDGGTQGLALLGYLDDRRLIVLLDAIGLGDAPGTVHMLRGGEIEKLRAHCSTSAHEGNALELLATARLLGTEPEELVIVGIEPEHVRTGVGLSPRVCEAIPEAASVALNLVAAFATTESLCV